MNLTDSCPSGGADKWFASSPRLWMPGMGCQSIGGPPAPASLWIRPPHPPVSMPDLSLAPLPDGDDFARSPGKSETGESPPPETGSALTQLSRSAKEEEAARPRGPKEDAAAHRAIPPREKPTVSFRRKEPIPSGISGAQRTARRKRNKCRRPSDAHSGASYAGFLLAGSEHRINRRQGGSMRV